MIYKIFCSNYDTVEKIKRARTTELSLEIRFTTSVKEIEANSFGEAITIYLEKYKYELNQLNEEIWNFFFIDSNGNIFNEE